MHDVGARQPMSVLGLCNCVTSGWPSAALLQCGTCVPIYMMGRAAAVVQRIAAWSGARAPLSLHCSRAVGWLWRPLRLDKMYPSPTAGSMRQTHSGHSIARLAAACSSFSVHGVSAHTSWLASSWSLQGRALCAVSALARPSSCTAINRHVQADMAASVDARACTLSHKQWLLVGALGERMRKGQSARG